MELEIEAGLMRGDVGMARLSLNEQNGALGIFTLLVKGPDRNLSMEAST